MFQRINSSLTKFLSKVNLVGQYGYINEKGSPLISWVRAETLE